MNSPNTNSEVTGQVGNSHPITVKGSNPLVTVIEGKVVMACKVLTCYTVRQGAVEATGRNIAPTALMLGTDALCGKASRHTAYLASVLLGSESRTAAFV